MLVAIGQRIREARRSSPLTLEHLASILDVSKQSIVDWETGKNRIQVERLPALAEALDKTVGWENCFSCYGCWPGYPLPGKAEGLMLEVVILLPAPTVFTGVAGALE